MLHIIGMTKLRIMIKPNADETVEKLYHSYIAGENAKWSSHSGKEFVSFSKKETCVHHMTQQLIALWAFIPEK